MFNSYYFIPTSTSVYFHSSKYVCATLSTGTLPTRRPGQRSLLLSTRAARGRARVRSAKYIVRYSSTNWSLD